jgi:hypothetical protein
MRRLLSSSLGVPAHTQGPVDVYGLGRAKGRLTGPSAFAATRSAGRRVMRAVPFCVNNTFEHPDQAQAWLRSLALKLQDLHLFPSTAVRPPLRPDPFERRRLRSNVYGERERMGAQPGRGDTPIGW